MDVTVGVVMGEHLSDHTVGLRVHRIGADTRTLSCRACAAGRHRTSVRAVPARRVGSHAQQSLRRVVDRGMVHHRSGVLRRTEIAHEVVGRTGHAGGEPQRGTADGPDLPPRLVAADDGNGGGRCGVVDTRLVVGFAIGRIGDGRSEPRQRK